MESLGNIITKLGTELAESVTRPNIYNYVPNPGGQSGFHRSDSFGRLLAGDNRSGKSVAGVVETVWWLTGTHPFIETPKPPVRGRVITVDFDYGGDQIIEPLLRQWIPPSYFINNSFEDSFNRKKHILKLRNGSELEIKTHRQSLENFAGVPRHFIWCDEEPPKAIFIESKTRLIDFNGKFWITMTPVQGITWVYNELVEGDPKNVKMFEISIRDNASVSSDAIEILESDLDEDEKQIRLGGGENFVPRGGLVIKNFDYDQHTVTEGLPPNKWKVYRSVDHGFNNPTAIYWHAVSPNGLVVTFLEHYRRLWTVKQHAEYIKELDEKYQLNVEFTIGDPSMSQRQATTGNSILTEYKLNGVPVVPGHKDVSGRIDKMNEYFRQGMWFISESCANLLRELRLYRWKVYNSAKIADKRNRSEEPEKKDDHSPDSCGYFFGFMPELRPLPPGEQLKTTKPKLKPMEVPWDTDMGVFESVESIELGWGEVM